MSFLKDKTAVVTGGSRGIGRAVVEKLAALGCNVAFSYQSSKEQADQLMKSAGKSGARLAASRVDVRDLDAVKAWIENVKKDFGGLDILVNNAGIIIDKPLMTMAKDDWQQVIDTNLTGMFNVSRASIVTFMKQKSGAIINISSVSGTIGLPGQTNYSASKGGINAFTKALAKEVASFGIRVNAVAPGFIETEILDKFSKEQKEKIVQNIPLNRIGTVGDVANCVAFLLGPRAQYITGQVIHVDGGLAMR